MNDKSLDDRTTIWIRRIARIWSGVVIALALATLIGYVWNWAAIGKPDPYAVEGYPPIENLIPITLGISVLGLAIAWRWEGLGGMITIISHLVTLAVHHWLLSPRPYPYPVTIAIAVPGILFLICWWRSRKSRAPSKQRLT